MATSSPSAPANDADTVKPVSAIFYFKEKVMFCLNGQWEIGINRHYDSVQQVPGLVHDATKCTNGSLWYKREVVLPGGDWEKATLLLYGAKYMPRVYVNGALVSSATGGLTITRHFLNTTDVKPNNKIILEIELSSINDVPDTDASKLPKADLWRSDNSSHIWNDIYLYTHKSVRIDSIVPTYNDKDCLEIRYKTTFLETTFGEKIKFSLFDGQRIIVTAESELKEKGMCVISLDGKCELWSPENPKLYTLETEVNGSKKVQKICLKLFKQKGFGFTLNGNPITLRMATMCWHRWQCDEQAKEIAYDEDWFLNKFLLPFKKNGGNTIRFHLGPVPERFYDLCDEYGMLVQSEWSFFHGIDASAESLKEQWTNWLDLSLSHGSIAIVHPWNEVAECQKLKDARKVINEIIEEYAPVILSHRDVMHIHKYWWSLFENVGVYYENKDVFGMTAVADEFGGNYLDYEYNPGGYVETVSAFKRFLGENNTKEDRIWLQNVSHSKIAEYWRRLGVAGFSPFCMVSGPNDGNTYYEGNLKEGNFKPVFDELKAAYLPISVSMNVWDRNYFPNQEKKVELYLFNDTGKEKEITCEYGIIGEKLVNKFTKKLPPYSVVTESVTFKMPSSIGEYTMFSQIDEAVSKWDVIVAEIKCENIFKTVGILECETELAAFLQENNINFTYEINKANVFIGLEKTYNQFKSDTNFKEKIELLLNNGISVALLGVGPRELGEGYEKVYSENIISGIRPLNPLEYESTNIAFDIKLMFKGCGESESCIHKTDNFNCIWENINRKSMWLWNGLKGGIIVPAVDMSVFGGDKESFEKLWISKGADVNKMKQGGYYAYDLEGYYEFGISNKPDENLKEKLRERVRAFVADAPSLEGVINPENEMNVTNLYEVYNSLPGSEGKVNYYDIAVAGKNLLRTPAVLVDFNGSKGKLLISQMIFDGRLCGTNDDFFALRKDQAAAQLLVNIIKNI